MPRWDTPQTFKQKTCAVCGTLFTPRSGVHKFCSPQCKGKWKYITGIQSTENQYAYISGDWSRYAARLLYYGGRKRDKLTKQIILDRLEKQNYKCALTGRDLTCSLEKGVITKTNASIDRIVAGGGYTPDNIQMVCRAVNSFRNDTSVEEFIDWCEAVAEHNKKGLKNGS